MKIGKRLCILVLLIGIQMALHPAYSDERGAGVQRTAPNRNLIQTIHPPQIDPLYQKHVAYSKAVFGSGWESHVAEIQAKWNEEVGTAPENLKTIAGFNNFFNFVRSVDNEMGIDLAAVDLQLKDLYETVDKQLKKESINPGKLSSEEIDKAKALLVRYNYYQKYFAAVKEHLITLKGNSLLGLKQKLEQTITAYGINLTPVSPIQQDSLGLKWKWAKYTFAHEARPLFIDNIRERIPDLEGVEEYWQSFEDSYSEIKSLLEDIFSQISFRYQKADGSYGFVSFVNFDGWSPQPFSNGQGGCGAIDTLSVHFLKEP